MNPGDVVWLDLSPTVGHEQRGHRPALVVSPRLGSMVIVVPLTSKPPKVRSHVVLAEDSTALCEQVRSVDVTRVTRIDRGAGLHALAQVRRVLGHLMGTAAR